MSSFMKNLYWHFRWYLYNCTRTKNWISKTGSQPRKDCVNSNAFTFENIDSKNYKKRPWDFYFDNWSWTDDSKVHFFGKSNNWHRFSINADSDWRKNLSRIWTCRKQQVLYRSLVMSDKSTIPFFESLSGRTICKLFIVYAFEKTCLHEMITR